MRFGVVASCVALSMMVPCPVAAQAREPQKPDRTVVEISGFQPKGGLVGLVEGDVTLERAGVAIRPSSPTEALEKGDCVRVRGRGRAEVLLNPGYFLRLFDDTEVTFLDLAPDNLKVKLSRGSAIVEVSVLNVISAIGWGLGAQDAAEGIYELVTVLTPQGEVVVAVGGLYRVDVAAGGATALKVARGLADAEGHRVERGQGATVRGGEVVVARLEKGPGDAYDRWSLERSRALVRTNESLKSTHWSKQMRKNWGSHIEIDNVAWAEEAKARSTVSVASGLITFSDDGVAVKRGESEWARPGDGDHLRFGDRVRTDDASRAAIQLYPSLQLYLAGGAEVVYLERPGGGMTIDVVRGSASVVSRIDQSLVTLAAPGAEYEIIRGGAYRLNVAPDGGSEMLVHKGRIRTAQGEVRGGKKVVLRGGGRATASIGKRSRDGFDVWSAQQATSMPAPVTWAVALLRKRRAEYGGMWYIDEASGAYTYVPGQWEYRSPYGGRYPTQFRTRATNRGTLF